MIGQSMIRIEVTNETGDPSTARFEPIGPEEHVADRDVLVVELDHQSDIQIQITLYAGGVGFWTTTESPTDRGEILLPSRATLNEATVWTLPGS